MNRITILPQFGFLSISGSDANKFMQGYTTCDVNKISEKNNLGAICNLKGRMVTNFRIATLGEELLLRMHKSRVEDTIKFLSPLSAYRGFFGCKHFSRCNAYLDRFGEKPIDWIIG